MSEETLIRKRRTADALVGWAGATRKQRTRKILYAAGWLISIGLIVEVVTLYWSNPTAFLLFLMVGATLVGIGALLYLWALLRLTST